jgi:MFS family permease
VVARRTILLAIARIGSPGIRGSGYTARSNVVFLATRNITADTSAKKDLHFDRNLTLEPDSDGKATRIRLLDFHSAPMRAFHLSWFAFFLSFVAWFGIAPLMAVVRDDLKLTKAQNGNTVIASVSITIFARLLAGWLCDRFGPRRTYSALLVLGALPVMGIGLSHSYSSFLFFRLAIGLIGASFVLTQYHTSIMFSRSVVGTANAVTAGWGNLGGGVTQWVMPLLFGAIVAFGADKFLSWRLAMIVPGVADGMHWHRLLSPHRRHSGWQTLRASGWGTSLLGSCWRLSRLVALSFVRRVLRS